MTGFAAVAVEVPHPSGGSAGTLGAELRSLNSRFLDLQLRLGEELRGVEPAIRDLLSARLARGKVECRLTFARAARPAGLRLDAQALAALRALAAEAATHLPHAAPLALADVLRWPGVLTETPVAEQSLHATAIAVVERALEELCASRAREGARLAAAIGERLARMRDEVLRATALAPQASAAARERLAARLREAGASDEERLRTELALLSARSDVEEELTRLAAHIAEAERLLAAGGPIGKRLDFLAQEMAREANTLAAKAAGLQLAETALALRVLIEQVREQVQNVE